jgi:hypothetical protein
LAPDIQRRHGGWKYLEHSPAPLSQGYIASYIFKEILFYNLMMISGVKVESGHLEVDSQGKVSAEYKENDVLLRKRA